MRFTCFLLLVGLLQLSAATTIHEENRCSLSGLCGPNPETSDRTKLFCYYNEAPQRMNEVDGRSRVNLYCPEYDSGTTQGPELCCDGDQMIEMEPIFRTVQQFFARCPACQINLLNIFCNLLCSVDQSIFINATELIPAPGGKQGATAISFFLSKETAYEMFDSCKDVQFPAANTKVMDLMCGGYTGDDCTPERWLAFFGTPTNGFTPFQIDFILLQTGEDHPILDEGMAPLDEYAEDCAVPSSSEISACSCQDCDAACPPLPTAPPEEQPYEIANIDGYTFIVLMVFLGLLLVLVTLLVLGNLYSKESKNSIDVAKESQSMKKPMKKRELAIVIPSEISYLDKTAHSMDKMLTRAFTRWGTFIASYPVAVLIITVCLGIVASCGLFKMVIITDPVELWSAPGSRARLEKEYFDETFVPFYRTEQVLIMAPNKESHIYETYLEGNQTFGPVIDIDILSEVLDFQLHLMNMEVEHEGGTITVQDVCNQPLAPDLPDCLIQSVLQWWQNDRELLFKEAVDEEGKVADWHDHFVYCMKSPLGLQDPTPLALPCYSAFGGPSYAYVCTGGYNESFFNEAEVLAVTFLNNNYRYDPEFYSKALAWEQAYLDYIIDYPRENLTFFYYSERSVEDEILRSSEADIVTIAISYIVIFAYIALALGDFSEKDRLMIDSKITLGLGGVLIVLLAVFSSLGLYAYFGVSTTLIIIEVVPFLILAVGADNMFIFSLEYQRDRRVEGETLEQQIGRVLGAVGPSLMMTGVSEGVSFFLGALTQMPAVKTFALYAGLAVLLDFVLQVTAFVALLTLDSKRQRKGRLDVLCCFPPRNKDPVPIKPGLIQSFMKKYMGPFLLNDIVRPCVLVLFLFLTCMFTAFSFKVNIGLDQNLAMPRDSYCIDYFGALGKYMKVGPPVYFVTTEGYDFSEIEKQNYVCGGAGCEEKSLSQQIYYASLISEHTRIAQPASSWIDDYFDWLRPGLLSSSCCRTFTVGPNKDEFCPSADPDVNPLSCASCLPRSQANERPSSEQFEEFLPLFLDDVPNEICNKGGSAAYGGAVKFNNDTAKKVIKSTYFMTYHTPLVISDDYITALIEARALADSITEEMKKAPNITNSDFSVWPYSLVYVYYEQYLTMVNDGIINLIIAVIPIFIASMLMLGFDLVSAGIIILNILMIVINTLGVMYLWNIEFNALSLVNLIMAVGMSVEFVSHTTRTFKNCTLPTRKERSLYALHVMGSSVLSGVAMTNLPGIIVLAFAKSQVFEVFYFRMFLTITLSGTWHGLVFLPVVLSYIGPGVNKARLYEEQQRKVEELGTLSLSDGKLKAPETDRFDEHDEVILKAPEEGDYENTAMEIDEEEMRVEKNHNETNEAMELAEEDIEKEVSMDHRSDQDNEDAISVNSNTQL
ncbi:putative niemann-Pick C1 protein-like [Apostichopus japonicus]|uniref:Putative niemann-Pick C1 protein-like n=1 Tax=Stichopus japonicus TaxID=307972 RepID=A0A2G8KCH0_STIJA|nr:putative niemann-Pick C1 protein-like [Apostichopus japonicus]